MQTATLPNFLTFEKAKKSDTCVIFAKKSWVATKLKSWSKTEGLILCPRPGPKPLLS